MRITEKFMVKDQLISFEVFPPKTDSAFDSIEWSVRELAAFNPDFMSVTYGAGGGTSQYTTKIASLIKNKLDTTALAHLTCASTPKEQIDSILDILKENHIDNILAMRGDIPKDFVKPQGEYYTYASDLVSHIKEYGYFDIGGACYPECHPECDSIDKDIDHLKLKVDSGVDFLITQLFYDNDVFYSFLSKVRQKGIYAPVFAGIMPVTSVKQIDRICSLSGTNVPERFKRIADRFAHDPEAMKQAGIAYATEQIIDLIANGVNNIHIYTMNKPDTARKIFENLSSIIKTKK